MNTAVSLLFVRYEFCGFFGFLGWHPNSVMTLEKNMPHEPINGFSNFNFDDEFSNEEHEERDRQTENWKEECYKFAQETTLHGLKYISLKDAFICRRLFWLILTCSCCGIMSYQIIDRIIYYYASPINVNVKVNYNRSLSFPSVTICNQNAFRSTAAAENELYRIIETMYNGSATTLNGNDYRNLNMTELKMSDLFRKTGHRQEDLIVGCVWSGEECTHEDFIPILTDHGLCYTFKPRNLSSEVVVKSTGSDHGLKLFLNVEQYEYMPGPNDAAGIKLLTYDVSAIPRMKELGISVPTNIHAFVGLQLLVINNLPVPYGKCQDRSLQFSRQYSTDACRIECINTLSERKCGCRNYYIPSTNDDVRECSIYEYHSCYKNYYKLLQDEYADECNCPTACHYRVFDPVVSYASTSDYTADGKLAAISTSSLQDKVLQSREVSQKLENRNLRKFQILVNELEQSYNDVLDIFEKTKNKISLQLKYINERYQIDKKSWTLKERLFRYQIYHVKKNFIRPRDAMEERTLSNLCVGFHEFVYLMKTNLMHLSSEQTLNPSVRAMFYTQTMDIIQGQLETTERALANATQLYDAYLNGTPIFRYKFENIHRDNNDFITPKILLLNSLRHNYYARRYSKRFSRDIVEIQRDLENFKEMLDDVNQTEIFNSTKFDVISIHYIDSCEDFYHSKSVFYMECVERPKNILETRLALFRQNISDYLKTREYLIDNLNNLEESLTNISKFGLFNIRLLINKLKKYLLPISSLKKNDLADSVLSDLIHAQLALCDVIFQETRNRGQNIYDGWTAIMKRIDQIWREIIVDPDMVPFYIHRNYTHFLVNVTDFIDHTDEEITNVRDDNNLALMVGDADKKLTKHFNAMREHMIKFKSSIKIDAQFLRDNFLQIDVFYRELSYEEITQQEGYDIFALLCDIGGSMGLFVGASVMTVFEIIDFVLDVSAKNAIRKKRLRKR